MEYLESIDKKDRGDGSERMARLRQIPPETGKFLAILATMAPDGDYIELGTSGGYSALWLSLACKELGRKLITHEISEDKAQIAGETFKLADVEKFVELKIGDVRDYIKDYKNISFCFIDIEKELYMECYELLIPRMAKGGLLVADNAISHKDDLQAVIDRALNDDRLDAMIVPIGKGELVCRKL